MNSSKRTSIDRSAGSVSRSSVHARSRSSTRSAQYRPMATGSGRVDLQPGRVGDHRGHRRRDVDRVAVGHDDGGVVEHGRERTELLEVLRRLEHPPPTARAARCSACRQRRR